MGGDTSSTLISVQRKFCYCYRMSMCVLARRPQLKRPRRSFIISPIIVISSLITASLCSLLGCYVFEEFLQDTSLQNMMSCTAIQKHSATHPLIV